MNTKQFQSKYGSWAIVTGASDGIGREFARVLAKYGLNTLLIARREDRLHALAAELTQTYGTQNRVFGADFSKPDSIAAVILAAQDLDVGLVIASAGFGTSGSFLDNQVNADLEMIDVNCRAVIALVHHFGQRMKDQKRGGIILLSSLVAFQGVPFAATYAATKAFIQTFAEAWHVEMQPYHVDVLAVAPGPVSSGFGNRANMTLGMAAAPASIAKLAIRALGHKSTVRPGFLATVLELALKPLPRFGRTKIMGIIMRGMTNPQH